jgi:hypothetical protein
MSEIGRISGQLLKDNLLRTSNLNFKNTVSDTALLHLEVTDRKIGINTESPNDVLEINGAVASTNLISPYANIGNISLQYITNNGSNIGNEIVSNSGDLIFRAGDRINVSHLETDDITINENTISTHTPDTNLELRPSSGILDIKSNTNITGSLYSTGNITFNAALTLGDDDTDGVEFNADINSDIIPDTNNTFDLGSDTKKWLNLYSNLLNGQQITVDDLTVSDTSLALRQGNIFYVSTLGDDTNTGDHQHGAFRTLKHALSVADASSEGPVTIHIYPGEYEEEFPLTLPERVTVSGEDIRNVIIRPTVATQNSDAFYLNQNCTVENLTVTDFYSPGYAFGFAPDAIITERSPYVRNVSVITRGTVTSESDPRGFDTGDAGRGALVDGSVVNEATLTPSMLFHSVTFITPGVDALSMTNGVRVEWLNSFTYFANRGLYAFIDENNFDAEFAVTGTITETYDAGDANTESNNILEGGDAFSNTRIELRSIGSANIYGNFGAVADGSDVLMYLIGHNFAYIGSGKNSSNDRTLTLFDQEIQEINQGKIYFTSTDADGTFRIGNAFYVNFEDGTASIDIDSINFAGINSIFINDGGNITYIDGERIDIGNIRFSGNSIIGLAGDVIWKLDSGFVNLDNNLNFRIAVGSQSQRKNEESDIRYNSDTDLFQGYTTANITFGGVYSENTRTRVTANNTQKDIIFTIDDTEVARFSGNAVNLDDSSQGKFGNIELNKFSNGDISIESNIITTTTSNSDLELTPNGSSLTQIESLFLYSNIIENFENDNLSLFVTDRGYVKFDTNLGFVVPYGSDDQQPSAPETGDTRWNTDQEYLEVWNGTGWQRAAGVGEVVTEDVFAELVDIYTLVLG